MLLSRDRYAVALKMKPDCQISNLNQRSRGYGNKHVQLHDFVRKIYGSVAAHLRSELVSKNSHALVSRRIRYSFRNSPAVDRRTSSTSTYWLAYNGLGTCMTAVAFGARLVGELIQIVRWNGSSFSLFNLVSNFVCQMHTLIKDAQGSSSESNSTLPESLLPV